MDYSPNKLFVKYPMSKGSIVGSILIAIIILLSMIITTPNNIGILSLQLFCVATSVIHIGLTIWWGRKKPHNIVLDSDQITSGDTAFKIDSIDKIIIKGSTIGFKMKQKRVVPLKLCMTLIDGSHGLQILKKWAESHDIKVKYGMFLRWF